MVAARETTLQELLEGSKQYQVPLYQRTYSWTTRQLQRLWEDIEKLAQDRRDSPHATHFIGSLVLAPSPSKRAPRPSDRRNRLAKLPLARTGPGRYAAGPPDGRRRPV